MKFLFPLFIFLLLFSCTHSVQYVSQANIDNKQEEVATIYFVNTSYEAGWVKPKVYVNKWLIGLMGVDSYLKAEVPLKETHEVTLRSRINSDTELPFTISPGEIYYIEVTIQEGPLRTRPLLKPLSQETGLALLSQMEAPKEKVTR